MNDSQKQALIFVREIGAIDNHKYRQMADCDTLKASMELRTLKNHGLLVAKGKGKGAYYVGGSKISAPASKLSAQPLDLSAQPPALNAQPHDLSAPPSITQELKGKINELSQRTHDPTKVREIITELCANRALKASQIAEILGRGESCG